MTVNTLGERRTTGANGTGWFTMIHGDDSTDGEAVGMSGRGGGGKNKKEKKDRKR